MAYRKFNKKKGRKNHRPRKPHWIYPKDLCWFKQAQTAYPAEDDWSYSENILRVIDSDEPIRYIKRTREGRGGPWVHLIECLGLKYVYHGSIHDFTKSGPTKPPDPWEK